MRKVLIIMALTLMAVGAFAAPKYIMLKCDGDSYTSLLAPDTNYGKATEVDSQAKFSYNGTIYTNQDSKISYFHYQLPSQLIGKVKVVDASFFYYVDLFKSSSPYKAGRAVFSAGLLPCLSAWSEMTITYNNSPISTSPAYFLVDSTTGLYKPTIGYNQFKLQTDGIRMLQKALSDGTNNGMALFVDVSGPSDQSTLLAGDYLNLLRIASRDTVKKMPYINLGYELVTGNMINGANINTSTLGEVKAQYH